IDPLNSNGVDFLETCLVKPELNGYSRVCMHYEALLRYCAGATKRDEETLVVTNVEVANTLKKAVAQVSEEVLGIPGETRIQIQRTLEEISEAVAKFHLQAGEGTQMIDQLKNWIAGLDLTALNRLQDVRNEIVW